MILQTPSSRDPTESPMSTELGRTYCKGGGLKTCTESLMSTEVWEDYCKLRDLKRPPVGGHEGDQKNCIHAFLYKTCRVYKE